MPPETVTKLTDSIITALPAAALAVLFAIFAIAIVVIFIRQQTAQNALFVSTLRDEGQRNRDAQMEQTTRWRDDVRALNDQWRTQFSEGMTRFAGEMGLVNQNVQALVNQGNSHDKTMQIGFAGLTNAVAMVTRTATGQPASRPPSPFPDDHQAGQ